MRFLSRRATGGRPVRLRLEALEDRAVPASILYQNGTLNISSVRNAYLFVNQGSNGNWSVYDSTSSTTLNGSNGSYNVTNGINITAAANVKAVTVEMASGGTLHGSLSITAANNGDFIQLWGGAGTPAANVTGNVTVNVGYGSTVGINTQNTGLNTGDQLNISGNLTVSSTYGNVAVDLGEALSSSTTAEASIDTITTVRGNVSLTNVVTALFGSEDVFDGNALTVRGNVVASLYTTASSITPPGALFSPDSTVLGSVSVSNTTSNINVVLEGTTGAATLTGGSGDNYFELRGTVNGSATVNTGSGISDVVLRSTLVVKGTGSDLIINAAGGPNTYNFDTTFTVGRNFVFNGAADNSDETFTFNGSVGGNASITLGGGDNSISLDTGASIAGKLYYQAGGGDDTLTTDITVNRLVWTGNSINQNLDIESGNGSGVTEIDYHGAGAIDTLTADAGVSSLVWTGTSHSQNLVIGGTSGITNALFYTSGGASDSLTVNTALPSLFWTGTTASTTLTIGGTSITSMFYTGGGASDTLNNDLTVFGFLWSGNSLNQTLSINGTGSFLNSFQVNVGTGNLTLNDEIPLNSGFFVNSTNATNGTVTFNSDLSNSTITVETASGATQNIVINISGAGNGEILDLIGNGTVTGTRFAPTGPNFIFVAVGVTNLNVDNNPPTWS